MNWEKQEKQEQRAKPDQKEEDTDCSEVTDLLFSGTTTFHRPFVTTAKCRAEQCGTLGFAMPGTKEIYRQAESLGVPNRIDVIGFNENCLFRAISKEIIPTEEHHGYFRTSSLVTLRLHETKILNVLGTSAHDYIRKSKMALDATLGTNIELCAQATRLEMLEFAVWIS